LRGNWQDFNWHDASRGPSAIAELLVIIKECVTGRSPVTSVKLHWRAQSNRLNDHRPSDRLYLSTQVCQVRLRRLTGRGKAAGAGCGGWSARFRPWRLLAVDVNYWVSASHAVTPGLNGLWEVKRFLVCFSGGTSYFSKYVGPPDSRAKSYAGPRLMASAVNQLAVPAAVDRWDRHTDGRTDTRPFYDAYHILWERVIMCMRIQPIIETARIVCRAGSMKRLSVLPSVCLSVCLSHYSTAVVTCSGFAAERRVDRRCHRQRRRHSRGLRHGAQQQMRAVSRW